MSEQAAEMDQYWIVIRDPNCVPQRKGPFRHAAVPGFLREAMAARPTSHLTVVQCSGEIYVSDGPEYLLVADGRSRNVALRHIERTRSAES